YLFIGAQGLIGPVTEGSFALSKNGLIPFTPEAKPANYTGSLSGHIYLKGGVDLGDAKIPLGLTGSFVLNLDPARTGKFLGGAFSNASDFLAAVRKGHSALSNDILTRLDTAVKNVSLGVNGTADLSLSKFGVGVSLPLARATGIYEGTAQKF